MQELANRYAAPIVGSHHDLASTRVDTPSPQGIILSGSGLGIRSVVLIGTYTRTFAGHPDERNWHKVLVFTGLDQLAIRAAALRYLARELAV